MPRLRMDTIRWVGAIAWDWGMLFGYGYLKLATSHGLLKESGSLKVLFLTVTVTAVCFTVNQCVFRGIETKEQQYSVFWMRVLYLIVFVTGVYILGSELKDRGHKIYGLVLCMITSCAFAAGIALRSNSLVLLRRQLRVHRHRGSPDDEHDNEQEIPAKRVPATRLRVVSDRPGRRNVL